MEAEMAVSSHSVELSDMNVVRDIDYQDLLIEHVKHQENGLAIKLCVKVKFYRKYDFYDRHKIKFICCLKNGNCSCLCSNFHTLLNEVQTISMICGPYKLNYCINEK